MACRRGADANGFSLIELLVALAVLAMLTAIVLPSLARMADRITFALQRQDIERQLNRLPQTALRRGRSLVLVSSGREPSGRTESGSDPSYPVRLPEGWQIIVDAPIHYRFDGSCDGGKLQIRSDSLAIGYALEGPLCELHAD